MHDSAQQEERWRALAEKALRGRSLSEITVHTPEGIELQPVYWSDGGFAAQTGATPGWEVRALLASGGMAEAEQALADGASSLWIPDPGAVGDLAMLRERGVEVDAGDSSARAASALSEHDDGADDATELAFLVERARATSAVLARVAIGCDLFATIAKVRALRALLPDVAVHGVQSRRWLAARDIKTNMVRSTAACFAAAVGGCDVITMLPFDLHRGAPGRLARRMAVTVQAVAAQEAHLDTVADAAAGSYLVERWTAALTTAVVSRVDDRALRAMNDTRGPLIGVSLYPNPADVAGKEAS